MPNQMIKGLQMLQSVVTNWFYGVAVIAAVYVVYSVCTTSKNRKEAARIVGLALILIWSYFVFSTGLTHS